jgi:hypothetical protein
MIVSPRGMDIHVCTTMLFMMETRLDSRRSESMNYAKRDAHHDSFCCCWRLGVRHISLATIFMLVLEGEGT